MLFLSRCTGYPRQKNQQHTLYKQHPVFIAEVLSPSTETFDRGNKFNAYRQLESLQVYWLIDTNNQPIDSFARTANNDWLLHSYTHGDEAVHIKLLVVEFLLEELYVDTL